MPAATRREHLILCRWPWATVPWQESIFTAHCFGPRLSRLYKQKAALDDFVFRPGGLCIRRPREAREDRAGPSGPAPDGKRATGRMRACRRTHHSSTTEDSRQGQVIRAQSGVCGCFRSTRGPGPRRQRGDQGTVARAFTCAGCRSASRSWIRGHRTFLLRVHLQGLGRPPAARDGCHLI